LLSLCGCKIRLLGCGGVRRLPLWWKPVPFPIPQMIGIVAFLPRDEDRVGFPFDPFPSANALRID
jgi:hypothetical protein